MRYIEATNLILEEYELASEEFPPMNSSHEGYAIILEELDELWEAIKKDQCSKDLKDEAKQVGAMALRFLIDCC